MSLASQISWSPGILQAIVEDVASAIDRLHEVSSLPQVSIVYTESRSSFARYSPGDRTPVLELSRRGPHPALSLTHEFGHLLDHALGNFDVYSTTRRPSPFQSVLSAANDSKALREWRDVQTGKTPVPIGTDRRQLDYWLVPQEVWARAYAQYVAVRSGSPLLLRDLQTSIDIESLPLYRNVQWQADDFEPIASAIDTALRQIGWLK